MLDWCRDQDDDYAGTVKVGDTRLDLVSDDGTVRVAVDGRYDI